MSNQYKIKYTLSIEEPHKHMFDIKIEVDGFKKDFIDFKMPVWTPGSYLIREFSKNVSNVSATSKDNNLFIQKTSKNTWRVNLVDSSKIEFKYKVYAYEKTVRTSFLNDEQAMINGASVFMIPDGCENQELDLLIEPYYKWKRITTTLNSYKGSYDRFIAKNYDELIDSPIEIGNHKIYSFECRGATHEYAITSTGNIDTNIIIEDSKKIVKEIQSLFDDKPPYNHYIFFLHLTNNSFGGLEHCNSCSMIYDRNGFKNRKKYLRFLGLVSHEFFHTWNVKRIRPKELGPFDYYNEVYTKLLWIAEGVTSYYDNLFLARSNVATIEEYFEIICNDLKRYDNTPGKDMMTVEDSSFDAWIKLYRPNENSINTSISYYLKGGLIIMALDLTIRDITNGEKSLDHVYQKLWIKYKDDKKGIDDLLFKGYCEDIAGQKLNHIWNYLNTTTPLNINDYLRPFGVELNTGYSSLEKEEMAFFGLIIRKNTTEIANTLANTSSHE